MGFRIFPNICTREVTSSLKEVALIIGFPIVKVMGHVTKWISNGDHEINTLANEMIN